MDAPSRTLPVIHHPKRKVSNDAQNRHVRALAICRLCETDPIIVDRLPMKIIGHRGAPTLAPENTLASFEAALRLGVDGIELDVHRTKDDELAVIHDSYMDHTDGTGWICDYTMAQIKSLQSGRETVPALCEVIEQLQGRCTMFIEAKDENIEGILFDEIENAISDVVIISFDPRTLVRIKRYDESIRTGLIVRKGDKNINTIKALCYAIEANYLNMDYIRCRRLALQAKQWDDIILLMWGLPDKPQAYKWCRENGIEGVVTKLVDSPHVLKEISTVDPPSVS